MGTCPRVRLPGGREDGYLCSPTAWTVVQCRSRTYTQLRYPIPLGNGHIPVPIWPQPTRRTRSLTQLCTVGIAFYILTKFQNNKRTRGKASKPSRLSWAYQENQWYHRGNCGWLTRVKSGIPCAAALYSPPAPMCTEQLWLQCGLVMQRIQTAHSHQRHATLSPHRQVTWQLQKRACSRGPDLHQVPLPSMLQPPCRPSEASTCREIVGPPTRFPGLQGGVPGLGNRGGDGDLASCWSGESGRIPYPLCSFLEFIGEFKRAPTSSPVRQLLSRL